MLAEIRFGSSALQYIHEADWDKCRCEIEDAAGRKYKAMDRAAHPRRTSRPARILQFSNRHSDGTACEVWQ